MVSDNSKQLNSNLISLSRAGSAIDLFDRKLVKIFIDRERENYSNLF